MSGLVKARGALGFTLIEVLVALVIVALGMSALLTALNESARNVAALRDKTVAEWIAMNQLALVRLTANMPPPGTTEGDVQNCGNGNWHWREQVNPVSAVPGLVSITVSVRRTGDAQNTNRFGNTSSARGSPGNTPGGVGSLAPITPLGPTAPLGTISTIGLAGCASAITPESSLGNNGSLGVPGSLGSSTSLGGAGALGSSTALGAPPTLGAGSSSTLSGAQPGGAGSGPDASASDSGTSSGSSSSSASGQSWLVSLTGFRGTSVAAPSGESPDWAGTPLPGSPGANGVSNGTNNGSPNGTVGGNGSLGSGGLSTPFGGRSLLAPPLDGGASP